MNTIEKRILRMLTWILVIFEHFLFSSTRAPLRYFISYLAKQSKVFATEGLRLALLWFLVRGHRVVCFLPDYTV